MKWMKKNENMRTVVSGLSILIISLLILTGCGREPETSGRLGTDAALTAGNREDGPEGVKAGGAAEPEGGQALEEYTFSGFSQGTNRRWELKGVSAEIFADFIKMFDIQAKVFAEETTMTITADEGRLYTGSNDLHMKKNVVGLTTDGARLTTDYLDWTARTETVTTQAYIVVRKNNIIVQGQGAEVQTDLDKVTINKKARVTIDGRKIVPEQQPARQQSREEPEKPPRGDRQELNREQEQRPEVKKPVPTVITCDGKLEVDYGKNIARFFDNVVLDDERGKVSADQMDIYFDPETRAVLKAIATGNVRIEEEGKVSYSEKAIYEREKGKITLLGSPKIIIYPQTPAKH